MNRRSLALLSFVSAVIASCLWFAFSKPPVAELDPVLEATHQTETDSSSKRDALPTRREATLASGESRASRVVVPSEAPADFVVVPEDVLWIDGRVDFPAGTPLGTQLSVEMRAKRFGSEESNPLLNSARVEVDGTFRLAFAESTRKAWLDIDGDYLYLPQPLRVAPKKQSEEVVLKPRIGGRIFGKVILPTGASPSAENFESVHITAKGRQNGFGLTRAVVPVQADGSFVIRGAPESDDYEFTTDSTLFAETEVSGVAVERRRDQTVEIALLRGVRLSGRVLSQAEQPLEQTKLRLELRLKDAVRSSPITQDVSVDENGYFEVAGLSPGTIRLSASAANAQAFELKLETLNHGDEHSGLLLLLPSGLSLSGVVSWPEGKPAAGVTVQVRQAGAGFGKSSGKRFINTRSNEKGEFLIEGLKDGPVSVMARAVRIVSDQKSSKGLRQRQSLKCHIVDVRPGTRGVKLRLSPGSSIVGSVMSGAGLAVERFTISASPVGNARSLGNQGANTRVSRGFNDSKGEFELTGMANGTWLVQAEEDDGLLSNAVRVELPNAAPIHLVLPLPTTVAGVVRKPDGTPAAFAQVWIEVSSLSSHGRHETSASEQVLTNERGEFEQTNLPPGTLTAFARASGWAPSSEESLTLQAGEQRYGIELSLRSPGTITGVVHSNDPPVHDRFVYCYGSNYRDVVQSDANGSFRFEGIPPGEVSLRLEPPPPMDELFEPQRETTYDREEIQLLEGETVHVVLGGPP